MNSEIQVKSNPLILSSVTPTQTSGERFTEYLKLKIMRQKIAILLNLHFFKKS